MSAANSKETCAACGKEFILSIERLPSKMDDKRHAEYVCPYCNNVAGNIRLLGNEEVTTHKIESR